MFPGWICQPAGAFSLTSPAVPFPSGRGHRSQAVLLPGVGKVDFPMALYHSCLLVKIKVGGVRVLLLGYKECTWKKKHEFTGAQIYFAIIQIQDVQCPVVDAHLKAFFSRYLISDRTTIHYWVKETTWEMLAKGLLESNFKAFAKPSLFSTILPWAFRLRAIWT